jgi:hypothetical protein
MHVYVVKWLIWCLMVSQIYTLRLKLKNTFRALTGNAGGHYYLDLSDPIDWHSGQKIAAFNSLEKNKAIVETPTRDTSQNGDFENFRNATFNGRPINLTSTWFINCPTAGRLHFDYVSTSRPVKGIKAMSTNTFRLLTTMLFISHQKKDILRALGRLNRSGKSTVDSSTARRGNTVDMRNTYDSNDSSDSDSDEEEQKRARKSFARGGRTTLGKTLLQKMHIQRKRETLIEQKKRDKRFVGASEQDINEEVDRILWEEQRKMLDAKQAQDPKTVRRREGFSMTVSLDAIGKSRLTAMGGGADDNAQGHSAKTGKGGHGLSLKRAETAFITWLYCIDSNWEQTKAAYTEYLVHGLRKAESDIRAGDPYGLLDPNYVYTT